MTNLQILLLAAVGLLTVSNLLFLTGLSRGIKGNTEWLQAQANANAQQNRVMEQHHRRLNTEEQYTQGLHRMIEALATRVLALEDQFRREQIRDGVRDADQGRVSSLGDLQSRQATHHRGDKQVLKAGIEPGHQRLPESQYTPGRAVDDIYAGTAMTIQAQSAAVDESPSRSSSCSSGSSWGGDSSSSSSSSSSDSSSSSSCD